MTMHTPPANQGQIVEVSYGWQDGTLYRRIYDRSDRSEAWHYASAEDEVNAYIESGCEPWNEEPPIQAWTACDEPDDENDGDESADVRRARMRAVYDREGR